MRASHDQQGFILMVVMMIVMIFAVAAFAFMRVHARGITVPATPLTKEHTFGQAPE